MSDTGGVPPADWLVSERVALLFSARWDNSTTAKFLWANVRPPMGVSDRLADDLPFDPETAAVDDEAVLGLLEPVVQEW